MQKFGWYSFGEIPRVAIIDACNLPSTHLLRVSAGCADISGETRVALLKTPPKESWAHHPRSAVIAALMAPPPRISHTNSDAASANGLTPADRTAET